MLRYVHKKASEIFPSLPINCLNKHRLDPVYLAHLYESIRNEGVIDTLQYTLEDDIGNTQEETDQNNINEEFTDDNVPTAEYPDREVEYIMISNYLYHLPRETTEEQLLYRNKYARISDCPGYYDNLPEFEELSSENTEVPHESECEKIQVHRDYYWSLCIHNCPNMQKQLLWWFTGRKRNRRVSLFILKRLGWSIGSNYPFRMNKNDGHFIFYTKCFGKNTKLMNISGS